MYPTGAAAIDAAAANVEYSRQRSRYCGGHDTPRGAQCVGDHVYAYIVTIHYSAIRIENSSYA